MADLKFEGCTLGPGEPPLTVNNARSPTFTKPQGYSTVLSDPVALYVASNRDGNDQYGPLKVDIANDEARRVIQQNRLDAPATAETPNANDDYARFRDKMRSFIAAAQKEYCHYFMRYRFWMERYIINIPNTVSGNNPNVQDMNDGLLYSTEYNIRISDFLQIMNAVNRMILANNASLADQTNGMNTEIAENFNRLKAQAAILKSEAPAAELKRRMVDYTKEKAKATNNLLSLYFFLDLVALGMLFYVYKAGTP